jgi:hypothetical protein
MKTTSMVALAVLALAPAGWAARANADSADATCQVRRKGDVDKAASGPCTFSQRQGYVDITLKNGGSYNLSPGERPNHFKDQKGHGVERTAAGGDSHTYKWDHMQIVVTFGGAAGGNQAGAAGGDETPADLKDLVGGRWVGGEVDDELTRRGYKQVKSDVQGDEVYSYWKSSKGSCVVVHLDASRHVASVAPGLASSCQ